jgi:hypothetical protein
MRLTLRALTFTLCLAAALVLAPAAFAADEAPDAAPEAISTPAPDLPPAGLDSAIPTSGTSGDCLINCGIFVGEWVYNVTYVQCCGQTHTCSDGSTGYGRVFAPPVGVGQRGAI